jgi:AdoMet-dependent heme synthase
MNIHPPLRLVAFEITRSCPLSCRHCRGDSKNHRYDNELTFDEIRAILDSVATFARPILIITGGEPLTRSDVFRIAQHSTSLGFITTLATCGQYLTAEVADRLLDSGVKRISVSIDGPTPEAHDRFRRAPGAFDAAMRGIGAARERGLPFQINSTLTRLNADGIGALHDLALSLGAAAFHPFLLVPSGRGKDLGEAALTPEEYERTLTEIARIASGSPLEIKPTCSPHYIRIARETARDDSPAVRRTMTKGCLGGQEFVFVSHRGKVQICGFLDLEAGDLRSGGSYDMKRIWETSPLFSEVRDHSRYHGKCGRCEYVVACGGCRARAYAASGDPLGEEPNCTWQPRREP